MNVFTRHALASAAAAAIIVASSAASASAQTIGTFPFALQPFCNVIQLTVTLEGNTYRLAGWDDGCGATVRQPVFGTIAPNGDGTLHLGFTTIRSSGIGVETSIRNLAIGPYTGSWTDSAGNAGTAVIVGISGAPGTGGARPAPSSTLLPNSVTTGTIVDGAVTTTKILDGSVGLADINTAEVQRRVTGVCAAGSFIRSIDANGAVVCGSGPMTLFDEAAPVNSLNQTCEDVSSLDFGTVPAGLLSCSGTVHATLDHVTATTSRLEFDFADAAIACGGTQAVVYEVPGSFPSAAGHDTSFQVVRTFSVPAGPLNVRLNARTVNVFTATELAHNVVCTFTPQ
jgi:hypothetical protein